MVHRPWIWQKLFFFKIGNTCTRYKLQKGTKWGFHGGAVVKNLPANAGDMGSSHGLGGSHMPRSN